MQAMDGNSLGATMILKEDAINEAQSILIKLPTNKQKDQLIGRLIQIYNIIGFIPRF